MEGGILTVCTSRATAVASDTELLAESSTINVPVVVSHAAVDVILVDGAKNTMVGLDGMS